MSYNITPEEFDALKQNLGAIAGQQNSVTAHMAHLARHAEASEQYWKNQAEGSKRMQYARPQDEMRAEQRIRIELDERRRQQEEINIRMKDAMNSMPTAEALHAANPQHIQGAIGSHAQRGPFTTASALGKQVDGGHYKDLKIQPIEFIHANNIPFAEGCAIKYLTRWRAKGGVKDLEKAKHFIELLIELESRNDNV